MHRSYYPVSYTHLDVYKRQLVGNRQTASYDSRFALGESSVQHERAVGNMDAILFRREVRLLRFQAETYVLFIATKNVVSKKARS